jgi:hypothetical protein
MNSEEWWSTMNMFGQAIGASRRLISVANHLPTHPSARDLLCVCSPRISCGLIHLFIDQAAIELVPGAAWTEMNLGSAWP